MGMVVIFLFIFLFVGGSSGNGTGLGSRLDKRAPEPQLPWGCGLVLVATPSLGAPAAFVRMGVEGLEAVKGDYQMKVVGECQAKGVGQAKELYTKAAGRELGKVGPAGRALR